MTVADGRCDIVRHSERRAAKQHACDGCGEAIRKGDTYAVTSQLFDGHWDGWKHCLRCDAMFQEISWASHDPVAIDPGLDCGEQWEDNFGEPPEHVAALAFWLPGDPLPGTPAEEAARG